MKRSMAGNGSDSTAAVVAWLLAGHQLFLANLILIGEPEDPQALWLTDWESPLAWPVWGTFQPAVVGRSSVTQQIGFAVDHLQLTYSPPRASYVNNTQTTSPYQLAQLGFYDNWNVKIWTALMPTKGDANTYGACELFGGRIASSIVQRGQIEFTVNSFLDVVNQEVPNNLISLTSTGAAYSGAIPPAGAASIPHFDTIAGSTTTAVIVQESAPVFDNIYTPGSLVGNFLAFDKGGSQTLGGIWASIINNETVVVGGHNYNKLILYTPIPWVPTPGTDTLYISGKPPLDSSQTGYQGFPRVPSPQAAI